MLVKLSQGHIVNTSAISSIEEIHDGRCKVSMVDETSFVMNLGDDDRDRLIGQIVPAPEGYGLIQAFPPSAGVTEPWFTRSPVLAFRASASGCVPIGIMGEPDGAWALVFPNGQCETPWVGRYEDTQHFEREYRKLIAAQIGGAP